MLERYPVGARVIITDKNLAALRTDCYSVAGKFGCNTKHYDRFVPLHAQEVVGEVTHSFPPGFDMTVRFGDQAFHLSQNHVTLINREAWADADGYANYVVSFGIRSERAYGERKLTLRVPVECTGYELKAIAQKAVADCCAMNNIHEFYPSSYELQKPDESDS